MRDQNRAETDAVGAIQAAMCRHATYSLAKAWRDLSPGDLFTAVALAVRDQMVERYLETEARYARQIPSGCIICRLSFCSGSRSEIISRTCRCARCTDRLCTI